MGLVKFFFKASVVGASASAATFALLTRKSQFLPVSATDDLLRSQHYATLNPQNNPPVHDRCVRRVRLDKIRPELVDNPTALVTAFCAGVWSGAGYEIQRRILAGKHQGADTAHQLWTREQMQGNGYAVGTQITNHFEVVERTDHSVVLRCGDVVSDRGPAKDGLFEVGAVVKREEGVVEFELRTVLFKGAGKAEEGQGMPEWMVFLHKLYTKTWMETAIWNCMK